MKKTRKIIVLIVVLSAPIIVFLFLKKFGSNQFELPIYYPEGNPVARCDDSSQVQHKVDVASIVKGTIQLPAIFVAAGHEENEHYSDLKNVLGKYPEINVWKIGKADVTKVNADTNTIDLDETAFLNFINCELAVGEDKWVNELNVYNYVLVDIEGRIRGYINTSTLKEIERMDTEVDILLNY